MTKLVMTAILSAALGAAITALVMWPEDKQKGWCSYCKKIAALDINESSAASDKAAREIKLLRTMDKQAGRSGLNLCPSPYHE